jgi:hypothetical protein
MISDFRFQMSEGKRFIPIRVFILRFGGLVATLLGTGGRRQEVVVK